MLQVTERILNVVKHFDKVEPSKVSRRYGQTPVVLALAVHGLL